MRRSEIIVNKKELARGVKHVLTHHDLAIVVGRKLVGARKASLGIRVALAHRPVARAQEQQGSTPTIAELVL